MKTHQQFHFIFTVYSTILRYQVR